MPLFISQVGENPGVFHYFKKCSCFDVTVAIFDDFRQFWANKLAFFLKVKVMIFFKYKLHSSILHSKSHAFFPPQFLANVFKKS
jgi:hypothetical protein